MEWRDPLDPTNPYQSGYNPQAHHLAKTQSGLWIAFKLALKILVYSPLLLTGYWLSQKILTKKTETIIELGAAVLFAIIIYQLLRQCKQTISTAKQKGYWWWVPIFILCVAFTCIVPAYLAFELVSPIFLKLNGGQIVAYLVVGAFTLYVYFQYDFLGHFPARSSKR